MHPPVNLTVSEASYVLDRPAAAIHRAADRGTIEVGRGEAAAPGGARRALGLAELRYLLVEGDLAGDLTPAGRRRVYEALRALPPGERRVAVGPRLSLDLGDADGRIEARLARLARARAMVDEEGGGGGEPVLRGSGLNVYRVAAVASGRQGGVEDALEDNPGLSREEAEAAVEYARAYPKPGRPYPPRGFKRMLRDMAEAGVFDPPDAGDNAPTGSADAAA